MSLNSCLPAINNNLINPHLGFGEYDDALPSLSVSQRTHTIGMLILAALIIVAIATLIGTVVAAPFAIGLAALIILGYGAAAGGGAGFLGIAAFAIFSVKNLYSTRLLPARSPIIDPQAPILGSYTKNTVLPTEHGEDTWKWKMELLKSTQQSCEISGNFVGGEKFREFLLEMEKVLTERLHVKVHIIGSSDLIEPEDRVEIARLRAKFPKNFHFLESGLTLEFMPDLRTIENHVKLFVVDGKYFMIGGTGLQKELGATKGEVAPSDAPRAVWKNMVLAHEYRDMDFVGEGVAAKTCRVEFFKLWNFWSKHMGFEDPHSGYFTLDEKSPKADMAAWNDAKKTGLAVPDVDVKLLISDAEKPNAILAEHQNSIMAAEKEIKCGSLIINDQSIVDCFNVAAKKNVKVSIVSNGLYAGSPKSHIFFATQNYASYLPLLMGRRIEKIDTLAALKSERKLHKLAVKVYEFAVDRVQYHKKALVIDGKKVIGGSYNYGMKSHGVDGRGGDTEISITMESEALAKRVSAMLDKDFSLSKKVTLKKAFGHYHNFIAFVQAKLLKRFFA